MTRGAATPGRSPAAAVGDVAVERRALEGPPADTLGSQTGDLDLLVVGSRGYGPLRRVVLGSVTSNVLRTATCPVLVLPRRTAEELDGAVVPLAEGAAN